MTDKNTKSNPIKHSIPVIPDLIIKEWKQQGKKIIGYIHSFIPEEILTAGGFLPFRIHASPDTGTQLSDSCMSQISCSFVRHCLDPVLSGEYDFIDGLAGYRHCDNAFRLFENWVSKRRLPYSYFINVPKKTGVSQFEFYRNELVMFIKSLEAHFGVDITDEKLIEAIALHNEIRRHQRMLYESMIKKHPALTGSELFKIMTSGIVLAKYEYLTQLKSLINELPHHTDQGKRPARLLMIGEVHDSTGLHEIIESQNALIVADTLSCGLLSAWNDVNVTSDPVSSLAEYYLSSRPASPRIYGTGSQRFAFIKKICSHFNADGIIFIRFKFCDIWGFEQESVSEYLKRENIPYLMIETGYTQHSAGQIKTRVQAFIETLEMRRSQ